MKWDSVVTGVLLVTHKGVFQFVRLPFGLATGPSAFQRVICKIIDGIDGCANILDDILAWVDDGGAR